MEPALLEAIHGSFFQYLLRSVDQATSVTITGHVNADMDALASALGLKCLLGSFYPHKPIQVIFPSVSKFAVKMHEDTGTLPEWQTDWPATIDLLIIVDTNDPFMVEIPQNPEKTQINIPIQHIILIDHHECKNNSQITPLYAHILPEFPSATEIICELFRVAKIIPPKALTKLLLYGILADTGNLRFANANTLENLQVLLKQGWTLRELMDKMQNRPQKDERIARLKAATRIGEILNLGPYLVVISYSHSFDASAARGLVELGADIAFILVTEKKNRFRMTGRAADEFIAQSHINLSSCMEKIGLAFNGSGGGHDAAAGCYGSLDTKDEKEAVVILTPIIMNILTQALTESNTPK